jgi:hypothetical protein
MALRIKTYGAVLGLVLVAVVMACGGPSEADIEATAEAMAKIR